MRRNRRAKTLAQRLCEKIAIQPNECWLWTGARTAQGDRAYGSIGIEYRSTLAHRASYELFVGPIGDGLDLDHLCRNRLCVNPEHLEPVTHRENLHRGEGLVGKNVRKTHCSQGHPFSPDNTRVYGNQRLCVTCSRTRALARVRKLREEALDDRGVGGW